MRLRISVRLTLFVAFMLALAVSAASAANAKAASAGGRCIIAPAVVKQRIAAGLLHGARLAPGSAFTVRSRDYTRVYMIAVRLRGPGLQGTMGVWATNRLGPYGLIFAVDGIARQFSDWGRLPESSSADDGVDAAKRCLSRRVLSAAASDRPAERTQIIDCGWWDGLRWSANPPIGFSYHLTTRYVRCGFARGFLRGYGGTDSYYPTWDCREINRYESIDVRCVSGRRVIRWAGGV